VAATFPTPESLSTPLVQATKTGKGLATKAIESCLVEGGDTRHSPDTWQRIIAKFDGAGVRVKVGVGAFNRVDCDNDDELMVKLSWTP